MFYNLTLFNLNYIPIPIYSNVAIKSGRDHYSFSDLYIVNSFATYTYHVTQNLFWTSQIAVLTISSTLNNGKL